MRHGLRRAGAARILVAAGALAGAVAVGGQSTLPGRSAALAADRAPVTFVETFNGRPAQPEPWRPTNWDVTYHMRDEDQWTTPIPMAAHHGADCSAAPATHELRERERSVYLCNDHMMTAIDGGSYGAIYVTPNHLVDFSQGEAVVKFDMSTFRSSPRDWVDLWISPYDDHLQLPLHDWLPDLNGAPRRSVSLSLDFVRTVFHGNLTRDFDVSELEPKTGKEYESVLQPSAVRRDTFELRISRTRIKFGMPQYDLWWFDERVADLGWDRGVVQFGHHSYDPTKECGACGANTWHWDNVSISPSVPFTMLKAEQRDVSAKTEPAVTFATPAPAGSHLRFAGIGENLEVSLDGGASWVPAALQRHKKPHNEHFRSYWMPIPEGTQRVQLRGKDWYGGDWHVSDISIWSQTPIGQQVGGSCGADGACPNEGGAEE